MGGQGQHGVTGGRAWDSVGYRWPAWGDRREVLGECGVQGDQQRALKRAVQVAAQSSRGTARATPKAQRLRSLTFQ